MLAHLLANWLLDTKNALENFTNMTGYQMPLTNFTPEAMVGSGIVPEHLSTRDRDRGATSRRGPASWSFRRTPTRCGSRPSHELQAGV